MKITVLNGTEVKGCTYAIKEAFLEELCNTRGNIITEFYLPRDLPHAQRRGQKRESPVGRQPPLA